MKRNLYLVAESDIDAAFIQEVLDLSNYEVRTVGVNGRNTIASYVRVVRHMMSNTARMIVVFDAGTSDPDKVQQMIENMRHASQTQYISDKVGIYAFYPDLEHYFRMPQLRKNKDTYIQYAREHKAELCKQEVIQSIQAFLNKK